MKTFLKQYLLLIITGVLAFMMVAIAFTSSSNHSMALATQSAKIQQLKNDLAVREAAVKKSRDDAAQAVTGVNAERKAKDDAVITDLMRTVLTWDSYSSYSAARSKVMSGYGMSEDSDFLTKVLPKVENRSDPSGKTYNVIDTQGLNSSFDSVDSRVSMVKATDYSYFAIVKAHSSATVGTGTSNSYYVVNYTTDANGKVTSITMDNVPQTPSTTG